MNQRDIDDVILRGREDALEILREATKEMTEEEQRKAIAEFWRGIPSEVKEKLKAAKPKVVQKMDEMYQPQGNAWGVRKVGKHG